jgi:hypothetical protein
MAIKNQERLLVSVESYNMLSICIGHATFYMYWGDCIITHVKK